ncbi:40246_t:CDS:2, partial [Gigaspora margarita]
MTQSANELEDLCQNTQNEIQTHQNSYTIPKSDTQLIVLPQHIANRIEELGLLVTDKQEITESGPAIEIDKQATNETNLVWKEQQKLDICKTQSNSTVEENNGISVIQKSYSQAVTG